MLHRVAIYIFLLAYAQVLSGKGRRTYGPEFTYTSPELNFFYENYLAKGRPSKNLIVAAQLEMVEAVRKLCQGSGCRIDESTHKGSKSYKVSFASGYWFAITIDAQCVEVIAKPLTLEATAQHVDTMQRFIFDAAASIGLFPYDKDGGGGHFNIGFESAFAGKPLLFRNFLVDQFNHPELAWWIFEKQEAFTSAPFLERANPKQFARYLENLSEWDQNPHGTAEQIVWQTLLLYSELERGEKNQAVNLTSIISNGTAASILPINDTRVVELRGHRAQTSAQEFLDQATLYDGRIDFLENLGDGVRVEVSLDKAAYLAESRLGLEYRHRIAVQRFTTLAVEAGLSIQAVKRLLPNYLQGYRVMTNAKFATRMSNSVPNEACNIAYELIGL